MTCSRTLFSRSSLRSARSVSRRIVMSALTSRAGRCQFSVENVYSVRTSTPRDEQPFTASRTDSRPARWPISRGTPRAFAQRPFPSMMIATCRGMFPRAIKASAFSALAALGVRVGKGFSGGVRLGLHLHHFGRLLLEQVVDQADVAVRHLLDVARLPLRVVGGQRAGVLLVLE